MSSFGFSVNAGGNSSVEGEGFIRIFEALMLKWMNEGYQHNAGV